MTGRDRPLEGRTVVVTRTRAQASALVDRLRAAGARPVELPVIAVDDPSDGGAALRDAADRAVAGDYSWAAFTSANAVARFVGAVGDRRLPPDLRWAAVGPATARTLADAGHPPDLMPPPGAAEAAGLAAAFPDPPAAGGAVLFPRAEVVRGGLEEALAARGWVVDAVVAYRTVAGDPDPAAVVAARGADAVAFTSSSTVARAVDLLGAEGLPAVVVSIGPRTSDAVRAAGLAVAAEAGEPTLDGLVAAVAAAFGP